MRADITQAVYSQFGNRLREVRTSAGLTQQQLAVLVGVSRPSISNIEAGRQHIQLEVVYRLAHALDLSIGDLLPEIDVDRSVPGLAGLPDADGQFVQRIIESAGARLTVGDDA